MNTQEARYCGEDQPSSRQFFGPITVMFHSNNYRTKSGFSMNYEQLDRQAIDTNNNSRLLFTSRSII